MITKLRGRCCIIVGVFGAGALTAGGCGGSRSPTEASGSRYVLASVVIQPDDTRTTYVQTIDSLADRHITNAAAIEIAGNGVVLTHGKAFYIGLEDEPTWVRYEAQGATIVETGRLSLINTGAKAMDYGNAIVDDTTAISVFSNPPLAVVWNPTTMEIAGEIDLAFLRKDGYDLEVWTTVAYQGKVYVPGRWSDWEGGRIFPEVSLTVLDPKTMTVLGTATDPRCASGGRVVFDAAGYGYVMGDGRNDSLQMFARAQGAPVAPNCLLRMAPGTIAFEKDYAYAIPSLTGGLEAISELGTARQGSGIAFSKMFYPELLPSEVQPVDFAYWSYPVHKLWQIDLGAPPTAKEIAGIPHAAIGFEGTALDGKLFTGESLDHGATSDVYVVDPGTGTATRAFTMDGDFYGLFALTE